MRKHRIIDLNDSIIYLEIEQNLTMAFPKSEIVVFWIYSSKQKMKRKLKLVLGVGGLALSVGIIIGSLKYFETQDYILTGSLILTSIYLIKESIPIKYNLKKVDLLKDYLIFTN